MKKLLTLFAVLLVSAINAYSVPAYPYPIKDVQPDGTTITVQIYGDEFFNYTLDSEGRQVVKLEDNFYYFYNSSIYASDKSERTLVRAKTNGLRTAEESKFINSLPYGVDSEFYTMGTSVAKVKRQMRDSDFNGAYAPPYASSSEPQKSIGQVMFPPTAIVILAAFKDVPFNSEHTVETFDNMLNERGYSFNGAVGCARDYYYESSFGQYDPDFDVSPIVTLSQNRVYYGGNGTTGQDQNPEIMVAEACTLADPDVDFTKYDADGDGIVDAVFVIFAGHNEAEGGPAESIWPHRFSLKYSKSCYVDGLKVEDYACTSELRGNYGNTLAGIGTFCHENGHVLGLPDYYDTDYSSSGGYSVGLYNLSIMCSGSYNSNGNVPPSYTAIEREFLGFMEIEELNDAGAGTFILEGLSSSNHAYKIYSQNSDSEYFILESIEETPWTAPYGATGMLISQNDHGNGYYTALYSNSLNNNPSHPYVRYRESYGRLLSQNNTNVNYVVYPGSRDKTTFGEGDYGFESWDGELLPVQISEITNNNGYVTFYSDGGISVNNLIRIQARYTTASVFYKNGEDGWHFQYRVAGSEDQYTTVKNLTHTTEYIFDLKEDTEYEAIIVPADGTESLSTTFKTSVDQGTSEIKVIPGATTTTFTYNSGAKGWSIFLTPVGSESELSYPNINQESYTISNLKAETTYEYMIVPLSTDDIVMGEFTTKEEVYYTYPTMQAITGNFNVGDAYTLIVGGLKSTGDINWIINGTDYENNETYTFKTAGVYEIECRIAYTDGSVESISRIVTVQ